MMDKSSFQIFALVLALCVFATQAGKVKNCSLNLRKELRPGHPLVLKPDASEFLYPTAEKLKIAAGEVGLQVVCPGSFIIVKKTQTNRTDEKIVCGNKGKFRFVSDSDTSPVFQIKDLKCSAEVQSVSRMLPSTPEKESMERAEIGLQLVGANASEVEFIPAIDEVVSGFARGQQVRWARTRIPTVIAGRESQLVVPAYRKGMFFEGVDMNDVYVRANQRNSFLEIFNNTELVDKYLPATGDKYFVQGQMISNGELFYAAQQDAAYIYDNILPVWEAIGVNGNWKLVTRLMSTFASQSASGLDVWSGGYQQLYLDDTVKGDVKFISLTHGVEPPQFLYKYVHDPSSNKGMVFVTLNNPHVERITSRDVICDKYSSCDIQYPEFLNLTRGYTYCCKLEDFRLQASIFGLPTFPGATPLL